MAVGSIKFRLTRESPGKPGAASLRSRVVQSQIGQAFWSLWHLPYISQASFDLVVNAKIVTPFREPLENIAAIR
jgi:hypothetical protein